MRDDFDVVGLGHRSHLLGAGKATAQAEVGTHI